MVGWWGGGMMCVACLPTYLNFSSSTPSAFRLSPSPLEFVELVSRSIGKPSSSLISLSSSNTTPTLAEGGGGRGGGGGWWVVVGGE